MAIGISRIFGNEKIINKIKMRKIFELNYNDIIFAFNWFKKNNFKYLKN